MLQQLQGYKTYGVMVLAIAYAAYGFFFAHTLDQKTAMNIVLASLGLGGIRSGLTTEIGKLLASVGIDPTQATTIKQVANTPVAIAAYKTAQKLVPVLLVACMIGVLLTTLQACSTTSSPAQTVGAIEITYTGLAETAATACRNGTLSQPDCQLAAQLSDAIDHKGADGQQHGVLVAARAAAQSGDSVTAAAALAALQQGVAAFAAYEAAKGLSAK